MNLTEQLVEQIWKKEKVPGHVIGHCKTVEKASIDLANKLIAKGAKVNLDFVKYGALLHDIGRAKTNAVRHGVTGYEILQKYPEVPEEVRKIVKCHVGAGISEEEASELGIEPAEGLIPETLEEKIVSYADNLVSKKRVRAFEETLAEFEKTYGKDSAAVARLKAQHEELEG